MMYYLYKIGKSKAFHTIILSVDKAMVFICDLAPFTSLLNSLSIEISIVDLLGSKHNGTIARITT